jgi:uncharacterized protein YndB with AHSA1/START domain
MHGPDGVDYPNITTYREVIKHQRLVYDHGGNDERGKLFTVTVSFKEAHGQTTLDIVTTLPTPEEADQMLGFIKMAGGNATWDRLAEHLAKAQSGREPFVINRSFEAPIARVYEMFANPKHFAHWLPPKGFTMQFIKADLKPGGQALAVMTSIDGAHKMYVRMSYREMLPPGRLVYLQHFTDEQGMIVRHAPDWPEAMLVSVALTEEGAAPTRVTITAECHGDFTASELAAFIAERGGMNAGWTGSFDQLEELLTSIACSQQHP